MRRHEIALKPAAIKDLDRLRKYDATWITDSVEQHLRFEPQKTSRSRIRKLRGKQPADYRLRVGDYRVFYTVEKSTVSVLRILHKEQTAGFYIEDES
jgi:addiction module RelE/StbE family toxin